MGNDDLVLIAVALLWRLLDSLASGAVVVALVLAGITVLAAVLAWLGRVLPTPGRSRTGGGQILGPPDRDDDRVGPFVLSTGDSSAGSSDDIELSGWTVTATRLGPRDHRGDDHG